MKILISFILGLLIFSCDRNQEKKPPIESHSFAAERDAFFNELRNTHETSELVAGITFDSTLLNNAELFFQYTGSDVKAAANLGIYLSDLNYCVLLSKSKSTKKYFEAVYELSKASGIEKNTLDFLMNRYNENINRNDSVKLILEQLLANATINQQGTKREKLAGIAMAAYQIENMHLILSTLKSFPENLTEDQLQAKEKLLHYILNQQGKFEVTYHFLKSFSDPLDPDKNPNYPFFDTAFRELVTSYQDLIHASQSGENKEHPTVDSTFSLEKNAELKDFYEKINSIRTHIIGF